MPEREGQNVASGTLCNSLVIWPEASLLSPYNRANDGAIPTAANMLEESDAPSEYNIDVGLGRVPFNLRSSIYRVSLIRQT